MADLHVQKKETNVWPWVLGALLTVAILWFVFTRDGAQQTASSTIGDTTYRSQPAPNTGAGPTPAAPGRP